MEIRISCCCSASTRITGADAVARHEADDWRKMHAGCPKLKYDYKAALEQHTEILVQSPAPSEPLVGDVQA